MATWSTLVSEQELARLGTNRQQQTTQAAPSQQQEELMLQQPPQFLDQHLQQPHQQPRPVRQTYKSCDFCARRKRKCSGGLPRCSLCIEKKQPYCHYQLKPVVKTRMTKQAPSRRDSPSPATSSGFDAYGSLGAGKRLVDMPQVTSHGSDWGVVTAAGVRSTAMVPGSMSLKRCRMSPSTATGLVGMQENIFLGDFFGCLGFLPLATESHVREAMVEMLRVASTPDRPQVTPQLIQGGHANSDAIKGAQRLGSELSGFDTVSEGEGWGGSLAYPAVARSPAMCMMWCAIALGSLMKGAPFETISEYVRLARESLPECFDESSVDNARALVMMSFLFGVMNDVANNDKYLSLATSIMAKLRQEDVPNELASMLLTIEKMGIFRSPFVRKAGADVFIDVGSTVDQPKAENIVQQKDACNLFLITDRKLKQVFFEDMLAQGAISDADEVADERRQSPNTFGEPPQEKRMCVGTADRTAHHRPGEWSREWGPEPPGSSQDPTVPNGWGTTSEPPPVASATKSYVEEALPELESLSKLSRSDAFSGVGGLLYHGNLSFMKAVAGKLGESFKSLEICVDVMVRYPGIVRFRSHMVHCALASSHGNNRRDVYEAVRGVYNSVRPAGWKCVVPFEEWTSMREICDHIFCRSVQTQMDNRQRQQAAGCQGVMPSPSPSSSPHSTCSWSEQHALEERGQGAQQAISVSPPPTRRGSNLPTQSTPQCSMNNPPGGTGGTTTATAAGQSLQRNMPQHEPLATDACAPQFVATATSAAVDVGDPIRGWSTIATTGQPPIAGSAPVVPAGDSTLESGVPGGGMGARDGEVRLTDEDLLDAAAFFLEDEGFLEEDVVI